MEISTSLCCVLLAVVSAHGFHLNDDDFPETKQWLGTEAHGVRVAREVSGSGDNHHHHHHRHHHHHHRRHMMPPFKYCCGGENNTDFDLLKERKELAMSCIEKLDTKQTEWEKWGNPTKDPFSCERMKRFKNHFYCVSDCMMKEYGGLNENGAINSEAAKDYVTRPLAFDWLKDLTADAVETCAVKKDNTWLKSQEKTKCSARAMNFHHCVWAEVIMTCPEEHLVKNDYCTRVREAFEVVEA